jgi:hypothetical protein
MTIRGKSSSGSCGLSRMAVPSVFALRRMYGAEAEVSSGVASYDVEDVLSENRSGITAPLEMIIVIA